MMGLGFGMGGFGLILMVLFGVGLIALAIWLVGLLFPSAKKQGNDGERSTSAREILKTRYARGELTSEEYREMLETIQ